MPDPWYSGATRYPVGSAGSLTGGPKKCTLHVTVNDPNKTSAMDVAKWMADNKPGSGYTLIYHPLTGECVQMLPANGSAKALSNPSGGVETNKRGSVHIQISVVANVKPPFTQYLLPGWEKLLNWVDSWGIPRTWYGKPPTGVIDHVSTSTWNNSSGWAGHCCAPENNHSDPGPIDLNILFAGKGTVAPTPPPSSGGSGSSGTFTLDFSGSGAMSLRLIKKTSPYMTGTDCKSWQRLLADRGYSPGAIDGAWGPNSDSALRKFQSAKGLSVDGVLGSKSGERLLEG